MKAKEMSECVIVDRQNCPVVNIMQMPLQGVNLVKHHWTEWALICGPVFGVLHSVFRNVQNPGRIFRIWTDSLSTENPTWDYLYLRIWSDFPLLNYNFREKRHFNIWKSTFYGVKKTMQSILDFEPPPSMRNCHCVFQMSFSTQIAFKIKFQAFGLGLIIITSIIFCIKNSDIMKRWQPLTTITPTDPQFLLLYITIFFSLL